MSKKLPTLDTRNKSKRRSSHEGSIRELKSGRFQIRVTDGKTSSGKQRQRSIGIFSTYQAATKALRQYVTDMERGLIAAPSDLRLETLLQNYFQMNQHSLSRKTASSYEGIIRRHINPHLGQRLVQSLKTSDIRQLLNMLQSAGASRSLLKKVKTVLSLALDEALTDETVTRNVARSVKLPITQPPFAGRALTLDELRRLKAEGKNHVLYPMIFLALSTGLRRGEICGLTWDDIGFVAKKIYVRRARNVIDGKAVLTTPKTQNSFRTVDVADTTISYLKEYEKKQAARGFNIQADQPIFLTAAGVPPHPDTLTHLISRLAEKAGLGRIRFHDLRHTFASLSRKQGVPVEILKEQLGHSDIRITLGCYTHAYEDERHKHALQIDTDFLETTIILPSNFSVPKNFVEIPKTMPLSYSEIIKMSMEEIRILFSTVI